MDDDVPAPQPAAEPLPASGYRDDDLVYVDPENRTVVGRVEWSNSGKPKSLPMKEEVEEEEEPKDAKDVKDQKGAKGRRGRPMRRKRVRYYPWGTYRAMKRIYKIEGKVPEARGTATLDDVLPKALNEAFWD